MKASTAAKPAVAFDHPKNLATWAMVRRMSGFALAAALACLAIGCGHDDNVAGAAGDFLALTYNVAGLPEGLSKSNPAVNTPLISPLLNGYDLVLVQEDWQTPDPNPLAPLRVYHELLEVDAKHPYQSKPLPLPLGTNPERPSALVSDGLNRFSQFPFGAVSRQHWAGCDDSAADCLSLKGFSVARTEFAPGVCVDVYNVHGEAGNTEHDLELKDMNMRDLIAFIETFSAGRAVIVGGDFNMKLRRARDAANLERLRTESGLSDACIALGIVDKGEIDKFFFRSNDAVALSVTSCRFETNVFVRPDGGPLSDHDALAVRFAWSARPSAAGDCRQ